MASPGLEKKYAPLAPCTCFLAHPLTGTTVARSDPVALGRPPLYLDWRPIMDRHHQFRKGDIAARIGLNDAMSKQNTVVAELLSEPEFL